MKKHHLIFEGAELTGKSWLMSQIYGYLEPRYRKSNYLLDGCHWFNCDIGIYGTNHGKPIITSYLEMFKELKDRNLLVEKFHLSDIVYNRLNRKKEINYRNSERLLKKLGFKIVLVTFPPGKKIIRARINDRLKLYPHYKRILRPPEWYIKQQEEYLRELEKTSLPFLVIETRKLPNQSLSNKIINWINE